MPSDEAIREQVRKLLDGLSDAEVRELCIKALRRAHANRRLEGDQVQMHGHLGRWLLPLLAERKQVDLKGQENNLSETFLDALGQPWMSGVFEFMVWFVRAGLAWPLGAAPNATPITLRLTRAGLRFLAADEDHPLLPAFLDRVLQRCPGLPDNVISLLAQGRACLDHGLMQPAIVLIGVAYEAAIEEVVGVLVARNRLGAHVQGMKAAQRINAVKAQIDNILSRGDTAGAG
jgi:hypothetical protein